MDRNDYLQLGDWRRRTALMYARWREESTLEPEGATLRLRQARGDLFHDHPQSPLPASGRSRFTGLSYFAYDPAYRMRVRLEATEPAQSEGSEPVATDAPARGAAEVADARPEPVAAGAAGLSLSAAYRSAASLGGLHWPITLEQRAEEPASAPIQLPASGDEPFAFKRIGRVRLGGPLTGATLAVFWMEGYSGDETYGAGRYLLDGAKGADLGGDAASSELLLDFNLAYNPSCAYEPHWNCPLAPPENTLPQAVRAGERLG